MKTKLAQLIAIEKGSKAQAVFDRPTDNALPYIQIDDLHGTSKLKFAIDDSGTIAKPTDILIAWDGANAGTVGFGLYGYIGSTIALLRPKKDVDSKYLGYFLKSQFTYFQDTATGATIPHVNRHALESLEIPLPPLEEQRRIAAILEEADHARRTRRFTQSLSDGFLQEVFVEMFGDPENQTDIEELGNLADVVSGVTKGQKFNGRETFEVPYLRVANVQDGYLDLSEIKTIPALASEIEKYTLQLGDIVMTEGGDFDKLGRGAIWRGEIENCIHQNHVFRVRLNQNKVLPLFFAAYIQSQEAKLYFLNASKQTTNLASINMTQLRALPVPIIPLSIQQSFTEIVEVFEIAQMQQTESEQQAEHLFQTLLHRAFRGEL